MAGIGPQVVQVLDFAAARAPELQALHELAHRPPLLTAADAKLRSQRNQRRRRANAFKSHQMPRRLRNKSAAAAMANAEGQQQVEEEEHIALGRRGARGPMDGDRSAPPPPPPPATVRDATTTITKLERPRCRKHTRRVHRLLAERSWVPPATPIDNDEDAAAGSAARAKWLPTHAWHAKRMLMGERFGHVLAQRRRDKGIAAALTALRKTAVLHDASYYGLLELDGRPGLILAALQQLTDPHGADALADTALLSGQREGQCVIHHEGLFPRGVIAPATFMWRPAPGDYAPDGSFHVADDVWEAAGSRRRQLWLWVHPAAFMEAATAVAGACHGVLADHDADETIDIRDRRGHVCRFALRGKTASAVLAELVRRPVNADAMAVELETEDEDDLAFDLATIRRAGVANRQLLLEALKGSCASPTAHSSVFAVRVQDPRLRAAQPHTNSQTPTGLSLLKEPTTEALAHDGKIRCPLSGALLNPNGGDEPESELILQSLERLLAWPTTATKEEPKDATGGCAPSATAYPRVPGPRSLPPTKNEDTDMADVGEVTHHRVPWSPLFSLDQRSRQTTTFLRDHELNALKASRASPLPESVMDCLVIRQNASFKHAGGWDLLVHPSFAPVLLNAMVFAGVMVVGLDEIEAISAVIHEPSFPRDFPDAAAGVAYWDQLARTDEDAYIRKPTAKRVAFEKLGVSSPFQPAWDLLLEVETPEDAQGESEAPNTNTVAPPESEEDDDGGDDNSDEPAAAFCVLRNPEYMKPFSFAPTAGDDPMTTDPADEIVPVAAPTLIQVTLSVPRRGTLEPCSMLYPPTPEDLESYALDGKWSGRDWNPETESDKNLLGLVTSAVYDRPKSAFRAIAFCGCEQLQRLFNGQRVRDRAMALTRTTTSRQLRPVLIQVHAK